MKDKVIYLQKGFWKQLQNDTSIAGLQCMMNVYEATLDANLRTDIEDEVWDTDPFLKILWKRFVSHQSDIELFEDISIDQPNENVEDLSAIYLADVDTSDCNSLATTYGILVINNIDLPRKEYLFKGNGFLLKKNAICYEDRYLQFKPIICYPCNSMILIDPYILSDKRNITRNLFYLLDAILPSNKLQVVFHLSIFSMLGNKNSDALNVEQYHKEISDIIKATRKGLNFVLTLYAVGSAEEFHRRMIITNNVLFSADDGFEVFKDNGQASKNASFDIVLPRLVGDSRQDMSNYLRWITIARNRSKKQYEKHFWGTRENRLFELVK